MPANGLTFTTNVPSGTSGDATTDTFSISDNSGTLASGSGDPGVLGVGATYIDNLDSSSISPLVSVADTVDYLIAPAVNVTFDGGLAGVLATQNFFVGGSLTFTDTAVGVVNDVNINVYGGELTSNSGTLASALSGSHVTVADGGQVNGSGNNLINALDGATIAFSTDGGGTISADATSSGAVVDLLSSSTVTGFSTGADKIDFTNATSNSVDSYTITSASGNSTMTFYSGLNGTGTVLGEATVQTTSQLTDGTYSLGGSGPLTITQDTSGTGFTIGAATSTLVCFVSGTLIATTRGEVAVEDLTVGDLAVTASGEERPIRWIGHKRVERPVHAQQPVRVMAGAFGEGLPARDLFLSPGHAVCVDVMGEVFVPVDHLINGATVARVEVSEVTYWHVELESHDVLLAEGLPCESYMDCGNRAFFGREYGRLAAVDPVRVAESLTRYARPFVDRGPIVEAIRARLTARAEALVRATDQALAG